MDIRHYTVNDKTTIFTNIRKTHKTLKYKKKHRNVEMLMMDLWNPGGPITKPCHRGGFMMDPWYRDVDALGRSFYSLDTWASDST